MEAEFQDYERNRKWNEIFSNIYTMGERLSTRESAKPANKPLNRYLDVVPYDKTRVTLERNNLNYINASHVSVPAANRNYILTQGPLPITSGHFWLMIWEQRTKAILMLNNLLERGQVKCHQYWPDGAANGDENELIFEDVSLKVELAATEKCDYYTLRTFKLTDLVSGSCREVLHFHYTHWPDFDLPKSSDSFLEFLYAVRASGCLNSAEHGPTVIHCSAGIGRSGTFVLVDSCLVMIEQNQCRDSINVIDVLLEMRKYRMGLIQTAGQLRFSFQTIIEGSKKILGNGKGSHSAAAAIVNSSSSSNSCRQAVLNSSNNSTGNVNAGAADVKMIQRLNGVIEAAKRKNEEEEEDDEEEDEVDSDELNEENDELEEEEEDDEAEEVEDEDDDDIILDGSTEQPPPPPPTESSANKTKSALESAELRKAQREAKRQKTLETIRAIKRKQKAVEDRLALTSRLVKWLTPVAVCGIAIGLYYLYLSRRTDDSLLRVNLE